MTFVLHAGNIEDWLLERNNDKILMKANYYSFKFRINKVKQKIRIFVKNDLKPMYIVDKNFYY